jgi:hypothetical protein
MANKTKAHTRYRNKAGDIVCGVTTILNVMNKPALVRWANNLGLKGIDVSKFVDDLANVGTLAHLMVENYLKKQETDFSDYTQNERDRAENAVIKFFDWEKENDFKIIESELKLVSEIHQFGGQADIYAMLNGKKTLIDLKTSKACYSEHYTQCVAYRELLKENGYEVEDTRILRIGRDEKEGFSDIKVSNTDLHWERFKLCHRIYQLNKKLK